MTDTEKNSILEEIRKISFDAAVEAAKGNREAAVAKFRSLVEETDKDNGVVHLKKVRLYEVSLVTFPANEEATVTTVRSAPGTLREFENFLRDAGYSGEDAKLIAGFGYKALEARRDGGDVQATLAGINSLVERVRKSIPHAASSRG